MNFSYLGVRGHYCYLSHSCICLGYFASASDCRNDENKNPQYEYRKDKMKRCDYKGLQSKAHRTNNRTYVA